MDKFEVTNKQYKAFMDAGGYSNKSYWNYPVYNNGKIISLESALTLLVDRTGRDRHVELTIGGQSPPYFLRKKMRYLLGYPRIEPRRNPGVDATLAFEFREPLSEFLPALIKERL